MLTHHQLDIVAPSNLKMAAKNDEERTKTSIVTAVTHCRRYERAKEIQHYIHLLESLISEVSSRQSGIPIHLVLISLNRLH